MLDIFNNSAFGVVPLTDAVNDLKYKPNRIAQLGLFTSSGVTTTSIGIERIGEILKLVKPTPRGGPGETRDMPKRTMRSFQIPHFQRDWAVLADEVQGVREFGSETALRTVQGTVVDKLKANVDDLALTEEAARLGAVTGVITYADGTTLDLFSEFGVAQAPEIEFDFDVLLDGELRKLCAQITRKMRAALGGITFGSIHAFVGSDFFDKILGCQEVRDTYKGWNEAQILRESYLKPNRGDNSIFEFGGIVFEEYGEVEIEDEDTDVSVGVKGDAIHLFPLGVPNLFKTYYGPADYIETVNTRGRRLYSKQWARPNGKAVDGETQMNGLQLCLRPKTLMKGKLPAA